MHPFLLSLLGGVAIGLAGAVLLLFNGRVAGISGIAGGLLAPSRGDTGWRLAFVAGLVGGGFVLQAIAPATIGPPAVAEIGLALVAGVLVGFGTRLGNGCTSGHGVCGLSRGSVRSLAATLTFMATAAMTVFVIRHLLVGV
jgi:uncharacterized membrane protein YedE/YeeE